TDHSPDGAAARAELDRDTLVELAGLEPRDDDDRIAAAFLTERLDTTLAFHDADEHLRAVRNIASPVQGIRQVFDLMSTETVEDWAVVARRLRALPTALDQFRASLREGMD